MTRGIHTRRRKLVFILWTLVFGVFKIAPRVDVLRLIGGQCKQGRSRQPCDDAPGTMIAMFAHRLLPIAAQQQRGRCPCAVQMARTTPVRVQQPNQGLCPQCRHVTQGNQDPLYLLGLGITAGGME